MRKHRSLGIAIVCAGLIMACSCGPLTSLLPASGGTSGQEDGSAVTPDPISVTATLDTDRAVSYQPGSYNTYLSTDTAEGVLVSLDLTWFSMLVEGEEGSLLRDYESPVTLTPISAIEGLPFSQGYLAAVHLAPEGARTVNAAYLTLEIPGEYDPNDLIGFAADGTGEDFHLFPASFSSFDGTTYAEFSIMHFSLYGVARIVQGEIEAQQAHPPAKQANQDDDDLAPLVRTQSEDLDVLAPLPTPKQLKLGSRYDRSIKPLFDTLASTRCSQVSVKAFQFNVWVSDVDRAGLTSVFQEKITSGQEAFLTRLEACLQEVCTTCIHPANGNPPSRSKAMEMLTIIEFARDYSIALGRGDQAITNLWVLANECATRAGLPPPSIGIAADGGTGPANTPACP